MFVNTFDRHTRKLWIILCLVSTINISRHYINSIDYEFLNRTSASPKLYIKSFEVYWILAKYILDSLAQCATYIHIILLGICNLSLIDFLSWSRSYIAQWVVIFVDNSALDILFSWPLNKYKSILGDTPIGSVFSVIQTSWGIIMPCLLISVFLIMRNRCLKYF